MAGEQLTSLLAERENADYVLDYRNSVQDTFTDWKERIKEFHALYGGDWEVTFPDEFKIKTRPKVMNLVQVSADDISRLVNETKPIVRVKAENENLDREKANALLRERVFETYWHMNKGQGFVPQFSYDLTGAGFAAMAVSYKEDNDYPCFTRLNPLGTYPNIKNNTLIDCLVVDRMTAIQARALLGPDVVYEAKSRGADSIEIIDYYNNLEVLRCYIYTRNESPVEGAKAYVLNRWEHGLEVVPVAWAALPSADGKFRGLFDQVGGSVQAMNRILHLELDYASELVYSPFLEYHVDNATDAPGPRTIYHKISPEGSMERVPPPGASPQLFNLMAWLQEQGRQAVGYPAQRQGDLQGSNLSAAFVNSTLGQLTTLVKTVQELIGEMRSNANEVAAKLDRKYINKKKALFQSADNVTDYRPSEAFASGNYRNLVIYGAGAGLDALNKKSAVLQDVGAEITSHRTAREQTDYILDVKAEEDEIDREQVKYAFKQKLLQGGDLLVLSSVLVEMAKGKTLEEAADLAAQLEQAREIREMQMKQAEAQAKAGPSAEETVVPGEAPEPPAPGEAVPSTGVPGVAAPPMEAIQTPPRAMQQQFVTTGG
jgi:hypothetical protein